MPTIYPTHLLPDQNQLIERRLQGFLLSEAGAQGRLGGREKDAIPRNTLSKTMCSLNEAQHCPLCDKRSPASGEDKSQLSRLLLHFAFTPKRMAITPKGTAIDEHGATRENEKDIPITQFFPIRKILPNDWSLRIVGADRTL